MCGDERSAESSSGKECGAGSEDESGVRQASRRFLYLLRGCNRRYHRRERRGATSNRVKGKSRGGRRWRGSSRTTARCTGSARSTCGRRTFFRRPLRSRQIDGAPPRRRNRIFELRCRPEYQPASLRPSPRVVGVRRGSMRLYSAARSRLTDQISPRPGAFTLIVRADRTSMSTPSWMTTRPPPEVVTSRGHAT